MGGSPRVWAPRTSPLCLRRAREPTFCLVMDRPLREITVGSRRGKARSLPGHSVRLIAATPEWTVGVRPVSDLFELGN